jgi:hypothetical protein
MYIGNLSNLEHLLYMEHPSTLVDLPLYIYVSDFCMSIQYLSPPDRLQCFSFQFFANVGCFLLTSGPNYPEFPYSSWVFFSR